MALPTEKLDARTCYLYLVRHGATDSNLAGVLQGRAAHHALSQAGRQQAEALRDLLSVHPLSAIYASPLDRAAETARIIAEPHGHDIQLREQLVEVDVGSWANRTWRQIAEDEPQAYQAFMNDPATNAYTGGETFTDVVARTRPTIDGLFDQHLGQAIAVVAHSVVNRTYLAATLGLPLGDANRLVQHNCAVNVLRKRGDKIQLVAMNSGFHLGEH